MARDTNLNTIMIKLAILEEKIDRINDSLNRVEALEAKQENVERFMAYTKGAAFVTIAGFSVVLGFVLKYLERLWI